MRKQKRQFSAEFKVQVLREQMENQIPVGKICERYNIQPNLFYLWKKELFSGAIDTFTKKRKGKADSANVSRLEEKLKDKDSLISEIVEDNLKLKKKLSGEY